MKLTYSSLSFMLIIGISEAWKTARTSPVSKIIIFPLLLPTISRSCDNQQQAVYVMLSILLYPNCLQVNSWHPRHLKTESPTTASWLPSLTLQETWKFRYIKLLNKSLFISLLKMLNNSCKYTLLSNKIKYNISFWKINIFFDRTTL